jgi:hypothetical protein
LKKWVRRNAVLKRKMGIEDTSMTYPMVWLCAAFFKALEKLQDHIPFAIGAVHPTINNFATSFVVHENDGSAVFMCPGRMPSKPLLQVIKIFLESPRRWSPVSLILVVNRPFDLCLHSYSFVH